MKKPIPASTQPNADDNDTITIQQAQSIIGTFLYVSRLSRPDICYAVNALAQLQKKGERIPASGFKQLLSYIDRTKTMHLKFSNPSVCELVGYSDSDYANDSFDDSPFLSFRL